MEKRRQYIFEWMNLSFVKWKCFSGWGVVTVSVLRRSSFHQDVLLFLCSHKNSSNSYQSHRNDRTFAGHFTSGYIVIGELKEGEINLNYSSFPMTTSWWWMLVGSGCAPSLIHILVISIISTILAKNNLFFIFLSKSSEVEDDGRSVGSTGTRSSNNWMRNMSKKPKILCFMVKSQHN